MICCVIVGGAAYSADNSGQSSGKSAKALIKEIKDSKDNRAKKELLSELESKKINTKVDADVMIDALDDIDIQVQEAAIKNISQNKIINASAKLLEKVKKISETKIKSISIQQEKENKIKSLSALALSEMKVTEALPIIIGKLGNAPFPADYDEKILGMSALNYGRDAVPVAKKKLKEIDRKNPYGKMRLLSIIMNVQDKVAIPDLRDLFEDNDPDIKSAAARGLRNLGEKVDVSKIIKSLNEHENKPESGKQWIETRARLLDEIGFSANPDAEPFLKERIEKEKK